MKKIISLIMVIAMLAAMSVVVWARYELCPDCEVRLVSDTWTGDDDDGEVKNCKYCGQPYWVTYVYRGLVCPECGEHPYITDVSTTGSCPHCN